MKWSIVKWRGLTKWEPITVPLYRTSRGMRLFKTLYSTICVNNCKYCYFRRSRGVTERFVWDKEVFVRTAMSLWEKNVIGGIFLSSGVLGDPEKTVEGQLELVEELKKRGFKGYVHLRLMPGTPYYLIRRAAEVADRAGINIEAPTRELFDEITEHKADWRRDIIDKLSYLSEYAGRKGFLKAGVDTQLIVGFGEDTDEQHLRVAEELVKMGLRRIYYSPFQPVPKTPLEEKPPASKKRMIRLFQATELLRIYGYTFKELKTIMNRGFLPLNMDPKKAYAILHPELFPVDVNSASLRELLRVPGIGVKYARRIIELRKIRDRISRRDLVNILGEKRFRSASKWTKL